jgi:hypothetical protein
MAEAGRNIPVDGPDIVPWLVFAHFGEFHALALERALILAGEHVVGHAPGLEMKALDLF